MPAFSLGHCGPPPRDTTDPRTRLLYLPGEHLIVTVECRRAQGGWHCGVVADLGGERRPGHLTLTDGDLTHAHTILTADPIDDPDLYALIWQARVRQQWLGGHIHAVARTLARDLRTPSTLTIDIDRHAATQLITSARLRIPGLRRLLARLTNDGLLTLGPPNLDGWGTYTLRIPPGETATQSPTTSPVGV